MVLLPFSLSRRQGFIGALLLSAAFLFLAALQAPRTSRALLQWIPMNYFSPYAAVPVASDGGSVIHAFTQKLMPVQDSLDLDPPDLGYGYSRLQKQAMYYRKRLAQLNQALHNRVYYAYQKHLLKRGIVRPAASSLALLQSELDALNAHVTLLAQELDDKNQLSAHMANLQSLALAKMMAKVHHLAALVHASAIRRIRHATPKPIATSSIHKSSAAPCAAHGCSSSDLKWMQQLSRALSLVQAQSVHQAQMMRHVTSLSREVELLRARLHRRRNVHYRRYHIGNEMRGRRHVALSERSRALPALGHAAEASSSASLSASARKVKLNKLLDKVEALNTKSQGSRSLDGLYAEIHSLQTLLSTLPPQKL
jgi:hypothetical protein